MHTSYFVAVVALYVLMMSGIWSTSHTAPISMEAGELDVDNKNGVVNLLWSANVSTLYPPSSPLKVPHGYKLNIICPADATSNIWIQNHLEQYEECTCNATGVENPKCIPDTTTRQVCQDEVIINLRQNSQGLSGALSIEADTTYYLISYSLGDRPLAGYDRHNSGGECLKGFRMALQVVSSEFIPGIDDETPDQDLKPIFPDSRIEGPLYTDGTPLVISNNIFDIGDLESSGALAVVNLTALLVSLIAVSSLTFMITL